MFSVFHSTKSPAREGRAFWCKEKRRFHEENDVFSGIPTAHGYNAPCFEGMVHYFMGSILMHRDNEDRKDKSSLWNSFPFLCFFLPFQNFPKDSDTFFCVVLFFTAAAFQDPLNGLCRIQGQTSSKSLPQLNYSISDEQVAWLLFANLSHSLINKRTRSSNTQISAKRFC